MPSATCIMCCPWKTITAPTTAALAKLKKEHEKLHPTLEGAGFEAEVFKAWSK